MRAWFNSVITNAGMPGEIVIFLWKRRLWWLIPMVLVLLACGVLLLLASASGVAPFIYPLF